jgi:hypothetical protein
VLSPAVRDLLDSRTAWGRTQGPDVTPQLRHSGLLRTARQSSSGWTTIFLAENRSAPTSSWHSAHLVEPQEVPDSRVTTRGLLASILTWCSTRPPCRPPGA